MTDVRALYAIHLILTVEMMFVVLIGLALLELLHRLVRKASAIRDVIVRFDTYLESTGHPSLIREWREMEARAALRLAERDKRNI